MEWSGAPAGAVKWCVLELNRFLLKKSRDGSGEIGIGWSLQLNSLDGLERK